MKSTAAGGFTAANLTITTRCDKISGDPFCSGVDLLSFTQGMKGMQGHSRNCLQGGLKIKVT